ncbi:hypothetical protein F52700_9390 [Fusarium sp. NRRL 52700]|nr:hypothetical protein F52700_9390 [Fusarium sp. NRRL 52700]
MIFLWISEADTSSFVVDASLVGNTLFLSLFKDEKPSSDSNEIESPDTTFAPSPTTVGQHHILEYSFMGLNLLVTSPGHLIRPANSGSEEHFARIITSDPELDGSWPRVLPLLWFSGTHMWVSGSVSDGDFKLRQDGLRSVKKNIRDWENTGKVKKQKKTMFWLLQYVRKVTMEHLPSRSCSIRFVAGADDKKRLEVYAASRVQQLPTLFGEFWS